MPKVFAVPPADRGATPRSAAAGACACAAAACEIPELYRNKIGRLAEALNAPETVTEAAEIMRGHIDASC
jgi:hypothetical protein